MTNISLRSLTIFLGLIFLSSFPFLSFFYISNYDIKVIPVTLWIISPIILCLYYLDKKGSGWGILALKVILLVVVFILSFLSLFVAEIALGLASGRGLNIIYLYIVYMFGLFLAIWSVNLFKYYAK